MASKGYFPIPEDAKADPDADHSAIIVRSAIAMAVLSFAAVALRFISRTLTKVSLLLDDWLILAALPFALAECAVDIYGPASNNFGRHLQVSTPEDLRHFLQATFAFELAYNFAIVMPKFSILALYYRVFGAHFRRPLQATAVLTMMFLVGATLTAIFSCSPVYAIWDMNAQKAGAKCINSLHYYIGQAVSNIIIDIVLLILPIIPVRHLQISLSQKIAVLGIFFIGIFVTICSILRLNQLIITAHSTSFDPTFSLVGAAVWSVVESNISIVCACLPSMRPLLRVMLHGRPNTAHAHSSHATGDGSLERFSTRSPISPRLGRSSETSARQGIIETSQNKNSTARASHDCDDYEMAYFTNVTRKLSNEEEGNNWEDGRYVEHTVEHGRNTDRTLEQRSVWDWTMRNTHQDLSHPPPPR